MLQHPNFEKLNAQWHPTKNGDLKLSDLTPGLRKVVWWICRKAECGCIHEWPASIHNRTKAKPTGCPFCSPKATKVCYHKSLAYLFPDLMKEWHHDKNGDLDPKTIPTKSNLTVHWKCLISCPYGCQHEWPVRICDRAKSDNPTGCPYCSSPPKSVCIHESIAFKYPEQMKEWDYTKNHDNGLDPNTLSEGSGIVAHWICPKKCPQGCPHEYPQTMNNKFISDQGCPFCAPSPPSVCCIHVSLEYTHPELAKEWHPDKNESLKLSAVSHGSEKEVWWSCRYNPSHEWKTCIRARTHGNNGCPYCKHKTEKELLECLRKRFPNYTITPQKRFKWCRSKTTKKELRFDFYIVELNLIIELDGEQHFRNVSNWIPAKENQQTDIYKMKLALDHDIKVIRITRTVFVKQKVNLEDILYCHMLSKDNQYLFICEGNEYRNHKALLRKALKSAAK